MIHPVGYTENVNREDSTKTAACASQHHESHKILYLLDFMKAISAIAASKAGAMAKQNEPLPTSSKFCYFFELKPAVAFYITFEYIVWILLLLSAVNLELECIETTDLVEFEAVLKKDLYYNIIFGPPDPVPHDNARSATIFLNTVLVMIFLLYFVFTPFLLVGLVRSSPNWFIPYLIYDIVMINLSGCFFIVALIVWNLQMFWICFIFFALKLNSAIGVFSIYKNEGGKVNDASELSFMSGLSPTTTMESIVEAVNV